VVVGAIAVQAFVAAQFGLQLGGRLGDRIREDQVAAPGPGPRAAARASPLSLVGEITTRAGHRQPPIQTGTETYRSSTTY
jgi:hypothetical protein